MNPKAPAPELSDEQLATLAHLSDYAYVNFARAAIAADRALRPALAAPANEARPAEPTNEMVAAYLAANSQYWREVDELPLNTRNPSLWRSGTPIEATRVSLRAALAASPPAAAQEAQVTAVVDERAAFEAHMSEDGKWPRAVDRALGGYYVLAQTGAAWNVWQARAALTQPAIAPAPEPGPMPAYGHIPWVVLRSLVAEAKVGVRDERYCDVEPTFVGHQEIRMNWNSLNRIVSTFAAAPQPTAEVPSIEPAAKALEFAEYMAKGAEQLLLAINRHAQALSDFDDMGGENNLSYGQMEHELADATDSLSECVTGLRSDIYEFRKRVPKAGASPILPDAAPDGGDGGDGSVDPSGALREETGATDVALADVRDSFEVWARRRFGRGMMGRADHGGGVYAWNQVQEAWETWRSAIDASHPPASAQPSSAEGQP